MSVKHSADRWMGRALIEIPFFWALTLSEEQFHAELRMLEVSRDSWPTWVTAGKDATVHWFERAGAGERDCMVICMRDMHKHTPIEVAGLLVHEGVHIWQRIRENLNEAAPSREFEAYSIQRIAINLMNAYVGALT